MDILSDQAARKFQIITSIHHQHVTACHDYASEPGKLWLITDYAPYGDLESLLAERSNYFSESETVLVARHILAALSYLHSMNIMHRDVKGENILVFRRHPEHYRSIDFDLSRFLTDSKDLLFCGTAALCAPEVFP
jgi:serine/threonine protein kinase